ncbi:UDP-Glycosyltransferase/glycogen phosphorylase [Trametes meyenii]|nr:UDP-Glycosyltransferase/glycogen phosphorylase [Trametes meyenii]
MDHSKHILLLPMSMWGHSRPMCTLASRIAKLRPVKITFLVGVHFLERVKAEIARDILPGEEEPLSRINFILLQQGENPLDPTLYHASALAACTKLLDGDSLDAISWDSTPCEVNVHVNRVHAAIVDFFMIEAFKTLHSRRKTSTVDAGLKLYTWIPVATNALDLWFLEDRIPLAEEVVARTCVPFPQAAYEVFSEPKGDIIRSPGLPPMYDFELHPQAYPMAPEFTAGVLIQIARILKDTDGVITMDAADYHPEAVAALRKWFGNTSREIVYAGPLVPQGRQDSAPDENANGAIAFLDAQLQSRGKRSVILISFGSMFWPSDPAKLGAVLDVLMEKDIPFVMSSSSPFASFPENTREKLETYRNAYVSKWIPQQTILEHPATGWCVSHAGHNTVLECIFAGVPMILWPIDADQPPNAVHLTYNLGVAYELLEVRHGTGLCTILRTGTKPSGTIDSVKAEFIDVLKLALGADGEAKRDKLFELRETLRNAWAENGVARREVEALLDTF